MDYWQHLNWEAVDSLAEVQTQLQDRTWWKLTKFATLFVWDAELEPGQVFLFGSESNGLPPRLLEEDPDSNLKLPMHQEVRSLNLASTATAVMYEAVRQFGGLS